MKASGFSDEELEFKVTTLGLNHSLATKWTSFVAVSRRVVNLQDGMTPDGKVPLPMVKGTTTSAYPPSISILGEDMAGNSTPGTSHGNGYVRCRSSWSCCLMVHPEKKQDGGHLYLRNNRIDKNEDFYLLYLINS